MTGQRLASMYRIGFGLLTLSAIVAQFLTSLPYAEFSAVNFCSYFTNIGNFLAAVVFLWVGISRYRTARMESARGAVTVYLCVVFLVYATLLSDIPLGILRPWINTVLHRVMPVAVLLDWLYWPPTMRLRQTWIWLALPLLYLAYTLVRGAIVGWYPYPFLDPEKVGGYSRVASYCVAITAVFVLLTAFVTWMGNKLHRPRIGDL